MDPVVFLVFRSRPTHKHSPQRSSRYALVTPNGNYCRGENPRRADREVDCQSGDRCHVLGDSPGVRVEARRLSFEEHQVSLSFTDLRHAEVANVHTARRGGTC